MLVPARLYSKRASIKTSLEFLFWGENSLPEMRRSRRRYLEVLHLRRRVRARRDDLHPRGWPGRMLRLPAGGALPADIGQLHAPSVGPSLVCGGISDTRMLSGALCQRESKGGEKCSQNVET
jgi:hypothetical protein